MIGCCIRPLATRGNGGRWIEPVNLAADREIVEQLGDEGVAQIEVAASIPTAPNPSFLSARKHRSSAHGRKC